MDLDKPTQENLAYILEQLGDELGVANRILLDVKDYDIAHYDDIKFLYEHVRRAGTLSPSETDAFIDELRAVRKA